MALVLMQVYLEQAQKKALNGQLGDIRRVVVEQQKDIAELNGPLKAILSIQAQASRR